MKTIFPSVIAQRSTPFKASSESWIGSGNELVMENPRFLRLLSKTTTKTRHDKRRKSFSIFRRFSSTYASSNIDKTSIQKKKSSHAVSMSSGESEKKNNKSSWKNFLLFLKLAFHSQDVISYINGFVNILQLKVKRIWIGFPPRKKVEVSSVLSNYAHLSFVLGDMACPKSLLINQLGLAS